MQTIVTLLLPLCFALHAYAQPEIKPTACNTLAATYNNAGIYEALITCNDTAINTAAPVNVQASGAGPDTFWKIVNYILLIQIVFVLIGGLWQIAAFISMI